jgi:hypothetical protein
MLIPIVLTVIASIAFFFFPAMPFLDLAEIALAEISGAGLP